MADFRFSYSASNTANGCQRKYWHDKVARTPNDPDHKDDTRALDVGKAFHEALENCVHDRAKFTPDLVHNACERYGVIYPTDRAMILAMCYRYLKLHEASGLKIVTCEVEIGNEFMIGYVDAVMINDWGGWWITDLKTAAKLSDSLLSRLENDPQLNLYSAFRQDIADAFDLDVNKFLGTRYRVTTKCKIKLKAKETTDEYMKRIYAKHIESYDIGVPVAEMDPEGTYRKFLGMRERAEKIWAMQEQEVPQNFAFCENYFRPCQFWSRCYGNTFAGKSGTKKIFDSTTMIDLNVGPQHIATADDEDALFS